MIIRKATPEDFPAIALLSGQVHQLHQEARDDIFVPADSPYTEKEYRELLSSPATVVLLAQEGEEPVGYAVLELYSTHNRRILRQRLICSIEDFCVHKDWKRQGYGRLLFEAVLALARRSNANSLELTVWDFNRDALAFYQAMGMKGKNRRLELALGSE